jgi:hypothetical protein
MSSLFVGAKIRKVERKTKEKPSFFAETEYLRRRRRQSYEKRGKCKRKTFFFSFPSAK